MFLFLQVHYDLSSSMQNNVKIDLDKIILDLFVSMFPLPMLLKHVYLYLYHDNDDDTHCQVTHLLMTAKI